MNWFQALNDLHQREICVSMICSNALKPVRWTNKMNIVSCNFHLVHEEKKPCDAWLVHFKLLSHKTSYIQQFFTWRVFFFFQWEILVYHCCGLSQWPHVQNVLWVTKDNAFKRARALRHLPVAEKRSAVSDQTSPMLVSISTSKQTLLVFTIWAPHHLLS